jgi:hypothetical protein
MQVLTSEVEAEAVQTLLVLMLEQEQLVELVVQEQLLQLQGLLSHMQVAVAVDTIIPALQQPQLQVVQEVVEQELMELPQL